jgi:hypothetical protein
MSKNKYLIPALSIRQPWAELILRGEKTIEIRNWKDQYRGDLYLHTGKKSDGYRHITMGMPDLFRGGYVGIIELAAILQFTQESWEELEKEHLSDTRYKPGYYAWIIRNPRRFESPVVGSGKLGLFYPEPDIIQKLKSAILF